LAQNASGEPLKSPGAEEESLAMWDIRSLKRLFQDLRYGARMLLKRPGFTLIAMLTLALAIGADTAIFSMVNAVLLRQLPFAHPDQLCQIFSIRNASNRYPFSLPDFCDYRDQSRSVTLAAFAYWSGNLTGTGEPERIQGTRISSNAFELLGVNAALGRTLLPSTKDVLWFVIAQSMQPALIGIVFGLIAAFTLTRLMRGLLFGVSATDPPTFAAIALLLTLVALLAALVPARRATKVDPIIALKSE
jgi:hypothetical protein